MFKEAAMLWNSDWIRRWRDNVGCPRGGVHLVIEWLKKDVQMAAKIGQGFTDATEMFAFVRWNGQHIVVDISFINVSVWVLQQMGVPRSSFWGASRSAPCHCVSCPTFSVNGFPAEA